MPGSQEALSVLTFTQSGDKVEWRVKSNYAKAPECTAPFKLYSYAGTVSWLPFPHHMIGFQPVHRGALRIDAWNYRPQQIYQSFRSSTTARIRDSSFITRNILAKSNRFVAKGYRSTSLLFRWGWFLDLLLIVDNKGWYLNWWHSFLHLVTP